MLKRFFTVDLKELIFEFTNTAQIQKNYNFRLRANIKT
jgi:hypothetical protein